MLVITAHDRFQQLTSLALEHDRLDPPAGLSCSGYLGPLLMYLDDLGDSEEHKHLCRAVLSAGSHPRSMKVTIEGTASPGRWEPQLEGTLVFEFEPTPAFRLHLTPIARPSLAG